MHAPLEKALSAVFVCALAIMLVAAPPPVSASPGAHGPNGEHLDTPAGAALAESSPRVEAHSEAFELVARLVDGRLSMMIDRYETNEPVLAATVEVENDSRSASARFVPEDGSYVVDDAGMIEAISQPGQHSLVFTLVAGDETDLLDGTLAVDDDTHVHAAVGGRNQAIAAVLALLAAAGSAAFIVRRRRAAAIGVAMLAGSIATVDAHGPDGDHDHAPQTGAVATLMRLPDGSVAVPKSAQRRMSVRTVLAPLGEAAATIELAGRVAMDPNASGRVQAAHGGRVEPGPKGLPVAGEVVRRGDILVYLRHHTDPYARAEQEALVAELEASEQVASQRARRLESLEGSVARKDIEMARAEWQGLRNRVRVVRASLEAREVLRAPVAGVVASVGVVTGQVVEDRDVLFEIVQPSALVIEATTADVGAAMRIETASLEDQPGMALELVGVGRSLRDGVLPLTFRAHPAAGAPAPSLAIGQPVTLVASLSGRLRGVVLPAASIVRNTSNEPAVWIKVGAERFMSQPVQFKPLDAQRVIVTQGLAGDNRVVVQGASLIAQIR
jgi:cobalt-zinc-cadmium efflux system membrane fusion protein